MNADYPLRQPPVSSPAGASFFVFDHHQTAEDAVRRLKRLGFRRDQMSLAGKGYVSEQETQGFCAEGAHVKTYRGHGAHWGGIWSLLLPASVFVLPGLGLVGMTGPLVEAFADTLDSAVPSGGMPALAAALTQFGGPPACIGTYAEALSLNKYLLLVHGMAWQSGPAMGLHPTGPGLQVAVWLH